MQQARDRLPTEVRSTEAADANQPSTSAAARWRPTRAEELALMHRDIFDDRRGFAAARHAFVTKWPRSSNRNTCQMPSSMSRPGPAAA